MIVTGGGTARRDPATFSRCARGVSAGTNVEGSLSRRSASGTIRRVCRGDVTQAGYYSTTACSILMGSGGTIVGRDKSDSSRVRPPIATIQLAAEREISFMDLRQTRYTEGALVKTKIIATVGPACAEIEQLRDLVKAGVDIFRLNFAHGKHEWLGQIVHSIRWVSADLNRPIGILGDLSGPKIRLGQLPDEGLSCPEGEFFEFVREPDPDDPRKLTCTYEELIDDLKVGDPVLLADGIVSMRVVEKGDDGHSVRCVVEQPGTIRSQQGVNLPGVVLSTPSLTEKDRDDLAWAVEHELDFVGLSFVRTAGDIRELRSVIDEYGVPHPPQIVAKIEKMEAVDDLEAILDETDAVMVARGDLGVEVDIAKVPSIQKRIIRLCNQRRIPVITATQMLDSMQRNEIPTRAEASDVANAVIDGSDAVMLSGETAVGIYPVAAVAMMSRIAHEAEPLVTPIALTEMKTNVRTYALAVTEAVTHGAGTAAQHLNADLIVVATHSGRTAMAMSKQRTSIPVLALSDRPDTTRRMCLYWGVTAVQTSAVHEDPRQLLKFVVDWGKREKILHSGSRLVFVTSTNWSAEGHDAMLVHVIP